MAGRVHELVLLFFIYACLGWGCEVAFAAVKEGRFINRGFLNGPICPIYGFGVVGVVLALKPVSENLWLLYVGSAILTTAIEFVTGFALEKLFHARWWDYSGMPLNIMGYVTLPFSLVWGAACLVIVRWVHPAFVGVVHALPFALIIGLDSAFGAVFMVDLCATVSSVRKLSQRLRKLTELGEELHAISDDIGQTISGTTLAAKERVVSGGEAITEARAQVERQIGEKRAEVGRRIDKTRARIGKTRAQVALQLWQREKQIADWLDAQRAQGGERVNAIRARFEGTRARLAATLEEHGFGHRRILDAFPNLRSEHYQEAMESLRHFYKKHTGK